MTRGRQPVENFVIETISDLSDPRLTRFRQTIFVEDLGLNSKILHEDKPHKWWTETFDKNIAEDAFKYSDRKWFSLGTDNIECIIENDEVVGISGCRQYGSFLRTSMHLYLLKKVRKKYPGIKYIKGGWFERHIKYAKEKKIKGLFFTVYAYSRKLQGLINNHKNRTISLVDKNYLLYINDVCEVGEYFFNDVPQTFFYYKLTDDFNIDEIINNGL